MSKKNYPLRINQNLYGKIEELAEKEDRSVNYIINKLIDESLSENKISDFVMKDIENYCKKKNMTTSQLIEQIWKAYKKTYK